MSVEDGKATLELPKSPRKTSLTDLRRLRGSLKGRITLLQKFIEKIDYDTPTPLQKAELELRLQNAKDTFLEFNRVQSNIDLLIEECELDEHLEYRDIFECSYYSVVAVIQQLIKSGESTDSSSSVSQHSTFSNVKLPDVKLPAFDGSYDRWLEFKNSYFSLIHKRSDLDFIQKFHYLRSSLSGSALQVISALEFTSSNYVHAWELLENRFHNERLLVHNHVKALFNISPIAKESSRQIRILIDTVLRNLRALTTLNEPTEKWDTLLIYLIVSKLDVTTEGEWENHKGSILSNNSKIKLGLEDLLSFLRNRADTLEMIHINHPKLAFNTVKNTHFKNTFESKRPHSQNNIHSYVTTNKNKSERVVRICLKCKGNHALYTCSRFINLSVQERLNFVDEHKLCRNCLRAGHSISECLFGSCKQCQLKHNSLLHIDSMSNSRLDFFNNQASGANDGSGMSTALHTHTQDAVSGYRHPSNVKPFHVLLSTALVEVADNHNEYHSVRALLDNGSEHCIITEKLCKRLNASCIQSTIQVTGVGQSVSQSNYICNIQMRSRLSSYNTNINCLVLPSITMRLPSIFICNDFIRMPDNVSLADPNFNVPSDIELLIGADKFWELIYDNKIRLPSGPYLQNSKLGWLVSGPVYTDSLRINNQVLCNISQGLDIEMRKFWEIENVPSVSQVLTKDEIYCENLFVNTTTRDSNGRFQVRIPFKESPNVLGDSYTMARNRFLSLERKLNGLPLYKDMYSNFMREYEELGHMTRITEYEFPHYFLPHHGVYRECSLTTKLRVVFDASALTTSNKSLNDIQHVGAPLQNDIFSILLRFRQHRHVACADVEKMFRQVQIQGDMRQYQLILWREKSTDSLNCYQLNTVTYGTSSAPYLSMRCIRQLANECDDENTRRIIRSDIFVDDLITGHDDPSVLLKICEKVSQVLKSGCFNLRKWMFSCNITQEASKQLSMGEHTQNKTLGLGWYNSSDELYYTTKINVKNIKFSKRGMLATISQIYDPLGLLTPAVIIAKVLLQKLWLLKIGWDDPVPDDVTNTWTNFIDALQCLSDLRIPRLVRSEHTQHTELHIFSDASQQAYGACAYIRTYDNSGIVVKLLCAKSKVAPLKVISIPRLELCGVLIGARLYHKIIESLSLKFDKVIFWTDSTIVLAWLQMSPHLLKTFVQNRVTEINELTGDSQWLHIDSKNNPADLVSRGLNMNLLIDSKLWWYGPDCLQNHNYLNTILLNSKISSIQKHELPELNLKKISCCTAQQIDIIDFNRFSSFTRLTRTVAYVLRFINNARVRRNKKERRQQTGFLSVDELDTAQKTLVRIVQSCSFMEIRHKLINRLPVNSIENKKIYNKIASFNVFLDDNELIRVGGRLCNSKYDYDKKHPILLCSKHRFTLLLFECEHKRLLHAGPQLLLATLREHWWTLGGRNLARKTVHSCVRCARINAKPLSPIMGNLPSARVEPGHPFIRCGVDYAGPVMILNRKGRGAKLTKGYICLFVCFVVRAIHLELVSSLSTQDYILAFKRFISRRGKPVDMFSDNGKNFIGAEKELSLILNNNSPHISEYVTTQGIKFHRIPTYASHFGGLWEAGVKSCKFHLKRILGNAHLNYEEFSTVLTQIEAILNSRPMSPMSSDPNDLLPLTPGHFLIGRPLTSPATRDLINDKTDSLTRYHRVEQLRQHFWRRWSTEYISELQTRTKWKKTLEDVKLQSLVLIKEDHLPPLQWRLGRIIRVFTGGDGVARVADIRTATGVIQRAFSKICPLPVEPITRINHTT